MTRGPDNEGRADRGYDAYRWVDPPIDVWVFASRLWAPQSLPWRSEPPVQPQNRGLCLDDEPGRLVELLVTVAGYIVSRVQFAPLIGRQRSAEVMLLPWGTFAPATDAGAIRLRELVLEFELGCPVAR